MDEIVVQLLAAASDAWLLNGLPQEMGAKAHLKMRAVQRFHYWVETRANPQWFARIPLFYTRVCVLN